MKNKKTKHRDAKPKRKAEQQNLSEFPSGNYERRFETAERFCEVVVAICAILLSAMGATGSHTKLLVIWTTGIAICAVVLAICFWLSDKELKRGGSATEEPRFTLESQTTPLAPHTPIKGNEFGITFGTNSIIFSEGNPPMSLLRLGNADVLTVALKNGKLIVNAALFDATIRLSDDKLSPLPAGWDANSDESAVEIIAPNGAPMFQLEYESAHFAIVRGVFVAKGKCAVVDEEGLTFTPATWDSILQHRLTPRFRYPSQVNKGRRN